MIGIANKQAVTARFGPSHVGFIEIADAIVIELFPGLPIRD
ncbi:hypothetical protein [Burkholderia multivorans]|nr:hypothetical protein [Burkholderia multivorans]